jgi:hypothetical protein
MQNPQAPRPFESGVDADAQWTLVASELRAVRALQREAWGDVDDTLIARYLSGEASDEESRLVEQAIETHPKVRECVEILREVFDASAEEPSEAFQGREPTPVVSEDIEPLLALPTAMRVQKRPRFSVPLVAGLAVAASLLMAFSLILPVSHFSGPDSLSRPAKLRKGFVARSPDGPSDAKNIANPQGNNVDNASPIMPSEPPKPGAITGTLREAWRAQPKLDVILIVVDETGKPKEEKARTTTSDSGVFEFKDLAPGAYRVQTSSPAPRLSARQDVMVEPGQTLKVELSLSR